MSKTRTAKKKRKETKETQIKKSTSGNLEKLILFKHTGLIIAGFYFVVVALISFIFHTVGDYGIETDFFWGYVPNAKDFLSGNIPMDAFRGPLYPMVLGIFGFLLGDFFKAGILLAVISASFVIYFTFELLKKIFSPRISFFVTLFLALNPVFIQYSYSAGTDMFFNALVAATLFFFFKNKELNYKNLILAAFFGGLSYLTRYNGIFLMSFVFVILFVNYWKINWFTRIKSSLLFVAVFLVTFSPWGLYCLSEKGSFFYNENYKNIAFEVYGKGKISWDDFWFKESSKITSMSEIIFKDTGLFLSTTVNNIADHFLSDMDKLVGWHVGAFVVLGLILLAISNPFKCWKSEEMGYHLVNLFFFGLLLLVFYSERFSLFLIPFYVLIAVQPFFSEKFKIAKFLPITFRYLLLGGLIIFTFVKSYSFNSQNINSGPTELLTLQDWYEQNIPAEKKGKIVAARKAHVAYYLDMKFQLMPMADSYDEFIQKLREEHVDYLYFGIAEAGLRREFQYLIDPKENHSGLEVVVYFENPPSVLYKVLKQ
ncbi:MAG: glycosyltransferase family 39 protein [Ignavibacteriaceae bacterium]